MQKARLLLHAFLIHTIRIMIRGEGSMRKIALIILSFLFSLPAFADIDISPLLNKVTLQLQSQQWVTTQSALVYASVNAAITDQDLGSVQANVVNKLKELSDKGEWHVVSFTRQLDQSGLERVQITAQARLPQSELSGLRDKAKKISKPGETYSIDNVLFKPSDEEIQQANNTLRADIYSQAKNEIDTLNKMYPNQKYYLYSIDFVSSPVSPMPMASNEMMLAKSAGIASPMAVGNKAELQATVVIASLPDVALQKINAKD